MRTPARLGRYLLERPLARGGMAEVFVARVAEPGTDDVAGPICVKVVLPSHRGEPQFVAMLREEARVSSRLAHPNIVATLEAGEADGVPYLAMELVDGLTAARLLASLAAARSKLPLAVALEIAIAVCRALHHAHTFAQEGRPLGIVHRDVTPSNVLLSRAGDIKLADFGVARAEGRLVRTKTGIIKGKAGYLSPEQVHAAPLDHRSDQFSTGILLWELLTGRRLFPGDNEVDVMGRIAAGAVPAPSSVRREVPGDLDVIVLRALSREPERRFPDMAALEAALAAVERRLPSSERAPSLKELVAATLAEQEETVRNEPALAYDDAASRARADLAPAAVTRPAGALPSEALDVTWRMPPSRGARASALFLLAASGLGFALGSGATLLWFSARPPVAAAPPASTPSSTGGRHEGAEEEGGSSSVERAVGACDADVPAYLERARKAEAASDEDGALRAYGCILALGPGSEEARLARAALGLSRKSAPSRRAPSSRAPAATGAAAATESPEKEHARLLRSLDRCPEPCARLWTDVLTRRSPHELNDEIAFSVRECLLRCPDEGPPRATASAARPTQEEAERLEAEAAQALLRGDVARAEQLAERALQGPRATATAHRLLGTVKRQRGLHEQARKHFALYLKLQPNAGDRAQVEAYLAER